MPAALTVSRCAILLSSALIPVLGSAQDALPQKYEFPELREAETFEFGNATMDFRRAFFIDDRAFVVQPQITRRYYLLILSRPNPYTGSCSRRPRGLERVATAYLLTCGSGVGVPVARIYELENRQQMREIAATLER